MLFSRPKSKTALRIWTALLSIVLLLVSNLNYHVHSMDHDPIQNHHDAIAAIQVDHNHFVNKHLSIDSSHADHHEAIMFEDNASPEGLMYQSSGKVPAPDFLLLFFLILFLGLYLPFKFDLRHTFDRPVTRRSYFTPLLRAPPLLR